jgi:sugar phosphate isomerase/epimerase
MHRREFLQRTAGLGAVAAGFPGLLGAAPGLVSEDPDQAGAPPPEPAFRISLAGWSLHRRHFQEGTMPLVDFPRVAREEFGIGAIELVNTMFPSPHYRFLKSLLHEAEQHEVRILLIMCDAEGSLSSEDEDQRRQAVRNHHKWIDIAAVLGCHSIRVNTGGTAGDEGDIRRCAESLRALAEYGEPDSVQVLVENHGGLSSDPVSLVRVMELAEHPHVGTLPDFGNFPAGTDRYTATQAMMPWARAVSAKCYDFDEAGNETSIDFERMLRIVVDAGYRGYVGIEYEGERLSEAEGILAARRLLERLALALG